MDELDKLLFGDGGTPTSGNGTPTGTPLHPEQPSPQSLGSGAGGLTGGPRAPGGAAAAAAAAQFGVPRGTGGDAQSLRGLTAGVTGTHTLMTLGRGAMPAAGAGGMARGMGAAAQRMNMVGAQRPHPQMGRAPGFPSGAPSSGGTGAAMGGVASGALTGGATLGGLQGQPGAAAQRFPKNRGLIRFIGAMGQQARTLGLKEDKLVELDRLNKDYHQRAMMSPSDNDTALYKEYYTKMATIMGPEFIAKLQSVHKETAARKKRLEQQAALQSQAQGAMGQMRGGAAGGAASGRGQHMQGRRDHAMHLMQQVGSKRSLATAMGGASGPSGSPADEPAPKRQKLKPGEGKLPTQSMADLKSLTERENQLKQRRAGAASAKASSSSTAAPASTTSRAAASSTPAPAKKVRAPSPSAKMNALDKFIYTQAKEQGLEVSPDVYKLVKEATEHRMRGVVEHVIHLSKARVDASKQRFPFTVSCDPRRMIRQIERREKEEKKQKEAKERERREADKAQADAKKERKKMEDQQKLTNQTALEAVGQVRKRDSARALPTFGGLLDRPKSFKKRSSTIVPTPSSSTDGAPAPAVKALLPPSSIQAPQAKYTNRTLKRSDVFAHFEEEVKLRKSTLPLLTKWQMQLDDHKSASSSR